MVDVAGHIADSATIGSIEFAVEALGVQAVMVLGHSGCGAVAEAMSAEPAPGQIAALYPYLRQGAREGKGDLAAAVTHNVQRQADVLRDASPVLRRRVAESQLVIAGGVYDLESRRVIPVTPRLARE